MAKKEKKPEQEKPFKVQGWKKKKEEPLTTDLSFEELIKLSVSENIKDKPKQN